LHLKQQPRMPDCWICRTIGCDDILKHHQLATTQGTDTTRCLMFGYHGDCLLYGINHSPSHMKLKNNTQK